jgi:hypothetical protein
VNRSSRGCVAVAVILASIGGCWRSSIKHQNAEAIGKLHAALRAVHSSGRPVTIPVCVIFGGEWHRVHAFAPYSSVSGVNQDLGFPWSGAAASGIEHRDDIFLFVFTHKGTVKNSLEVPQIGVSIQLRQQQGGVERSNAVLRISRLSSDVIEMLLATDEKAAGRCP